MFVRTGKREPEPAARALAAASRRAGNQPSVGAERRLGRKGESGVLVGDGYAVHGEAGVDADAPGGLGNLAFEDEG